MVDILAYLATFWLLISYAVMNKTGNKSQYNLANGICWMPILASSVIHQAWPGAVVTFSFGMIGAYGYVDGKRARVDKKHRSANERILGGNKGSEG